jgi:hypothetical protein
MGRWGTGRRFLHLVASDSSCPGRRSTTCLHFTAPARAGRSQFADFRSRTQCKHSPGRRHRLPRILPDMRLMGRTIKRALLTCVSWCWVETTHASRVRYGANVVSLGGNIKRSAPKLHGYSHVRVARNYDLNVKQ